LPCPTLESLVDYVSCSGPHFLIPVYKILLTNHTRTESTADRYRDMIIQKTMTTVVDPTVSAREGNDTFFNSPRTSLKNSRIESVNFLNMRTSPSLLRERTRSPQTYSQSTVGIDPDPSTTHRLAGALGFEPRLSVLETDVLPLTPCPYDGWKPSH
jgi:hypothetical protein